MTQTIRDEYLLRQDWRLLNNGSYGACPKSVFAVYQDLQAQFEYHPAGFIGTWPERLRVARTHLATYLGTTQERLGFVTNATMGVNVFSNSLRNWLKPGDEVLSTNHEYGACNHAWQYACAKSGAVYVNHPINLPLQSEAEFVEQLWTGVTPRTRVIYLSHTTSPTALTFPLESLIKRAREHGILSVIDGAHVPGQRDLDLDTLDADFYTGNCHKWMCAPKGTAFVYVKPEVQHMIEPLIVGHGWVPENRSTQPLYDYVEFFGTRDIAAFLAVPAAIEYMAKQDWPAVRARCHAMALDTKRIVEQALGTASVCPETFAWFSQMVPIRLPDSTDNGKLGALLREHYNIELPIVNWNGFKFARLSVQNYTSQDELDAFVEAITTHAPVATNP